MVTYHTGRNCGNCGALLTVRENEPAHNFNRRNHCNSSCASRAKSQTTPIPHGTQPGYQRCRKQPGGACTPCREAQTRDLKGRGYGAIRAARERAMRELARMYSADFEALLEKELSA